MHEALSSLAKQFEGLDSGRPSENLIGPSLRSYLPFVGEAYPLNDDNPRRPRVAFYSMAQNLAGHRTEVRRYASSKDKGARRLYARWESKERTLGIRPWQTLHAQILTGFALRTLESRGFHQSVGCVTSNAVFTNFVKWSYQTKSGTDQNPPKDAFQYARRYVDLELDVLKPDLILAMGGKVHDAFGETPQVVKVRHSSPLVTNSLRGVARDLEHSPEPDELIINPESLVARWIETLSGLKFRLRQPDKETAEVGAEALYDPLMTDWLYYLLSERQIRAQMRSTT
ncbi:MAG: hypothetical protein ACE366_24665 [Bradymonadia bacterium]